MKRKIDGKGLPHGITVLGFAVFIVLGLACASTPDNLDELKTYSEQIKVSGLSQPEVFAKVKMYFDEAFKVHKNSVINISDQDSGIIKGKLVVDGIQRGDNLYRYNSAFIVNISDETCQITFSEPTLQEIGYITEQAKERAFMAYLAGRKATAAAASKLTSSVSLPSNQVNKTDAEIKAEWETKNVFSSTNPGSASPVRYDYQVENVRGQWLKFTNELKRAIIVN